MGSIGSSVCFEKRNLTFECQEMGFLEVVRPGNGQASSRWHQELTAHFVNSEVNNFEENFRQKMGTLETLCQGWRGAPQGLSVQFVSTCSRGCGLPGYTLKISPSCDL